jgi:hypothetical protein
MTNLEIALVCDPSCDGLTTAYVDLALCRASTRDMRESASYAGIVQEQRVSAIARDIRSTYCTDSRKPLTASPRTTPIEPRSGDAGLRGHLDLICGASTGLHPSELVTAIARRLLEEWPDLEAVVKDGSTSNN